MDGKQYRLADRQSKERVHTTAEQATFFLITPYSKFTSMTANENTNNSRYFHS